MQEQLTAALVEEATRKSALIWVSTGGPDATGGSGAGGTEDGNGPGDGSAADRSQPVWHVWFAGAAHLVTGGAEQPLPGLDRAIATGSTVTVTVRSKDKGGRLVSYLARPHRLLPGSEEWDTAVAELHAKRLNAPDGEEQPARWARESMVVRLEPTGDVVEQPGRMPAGSHAAPPPRTPATTVGRLPFMLGGRPRRTRRRTR